LQSFRAWQQHAEVERAGEPALVQPVPPLHDLAVVIRNGRIWGAGVQLPLAEEGTVPSSLGARHRAAAGVTLDNDCIAVVVSEENGGIRIAESGKLSEPIPPKEFRDALLRRLSAQTPGFVFDRRGEGTPS
jgi:diadenylate cyclase